jgi:hypothetical protein
MGTGAAVTERPASAQDADRLGFGESARVRAFLLQKARTPVP